jgi:hypothetical protein
MSDPPEAVNHQDARNEHPDEAQQDEQIKWHLRTVSSGIHQRPINEFVDRLISMGASCNPSKRPPKGREAPRTGTFDPSTRNRPAGL